MPPLFPCSAAYSPVSSGTTTVCSLPGNSVGCRGGRALPATWGRPAPDLSLGSAAGHSLRLVPPSLTVMADGSCPWAGPGSPLCPPGFPGVFRPPPVASSSPLSLAVFPPPSCYSFCPGKRGTALFWDRDQSSSPLQDEFAAVMMNYDDKYLYTAFRSKVVHNQWLPVPSLKREEQQPLEKDAKLGVGVGKRDAISRRN